MRSPPGRIAILAGGALLALLGWRPGEVRAQPTTSGYPSRGPTAETAAQPGWAGAAATGSAATGGLSGGLPVSRPGWKPQVIATARPVGTEPAGPRAAIIAPAGMAAPGLAAAPVTPADGLLAVRVSTSSPLTAPDRDGLKEGAPGTVPRSSTAGTVATMPRVEGSDPPELLPGLDRPGARASSRNTGSSGTESGRLGPTAAAALSVEKAATASALAGQPLTYEIAVRNGGSAAALGVRVEEQLPAGVRLVASEPAAEVKGQSLVWQLGRLAAGGEALVRVQVQPSGEGEFVSTAVITSFASCTLRVPVARAGLAVALEAPAGVRLGEAVPLRIRLSNGLGTPVKRVVVRMRLPEGLKHPAGEYIEAELPGLAAGEKTVVPLEARAAMGGKLQSTVTVSAEGVSPVSAVALVSVEERGSSPFLAPSARRDGADLTGVTGRDRPGGSGPPRRALSGDATRPAPNEGAPPVMPSPGIPSSALPLSLPPSPPSPVPPASPGQGEGELVLNVSGQESQVEIGDESVYEVRVVNTGSREARDLRVRVLVPAGMELVEAGGATGQRVRGNEVSFAPLARLAAQSAAVYQVRARAARAGDHRLRAWLEGGPGGEANRGEVVTRVTAGSDRPAGPPLGDAERQHK